MWKVCLDILRGGPELATEILALQQHKNGLVELVNSIF